MDFKKVIMSSPDKDKIETCEGEVSIVDVVCKLGYRGRNIVIKARDRTEEEYGQISQEYETAYQKTETLLTETDEDKRPKPEEIFWPPEDSPDKRPILIEEMNRILYLTVAYHLGAREKILDEGWYGIDAGLILKPKGTFFRRKGELEVSAENLEALPLLLRNRIVTAVADHFRVSDEAEAKNLSGR